MANVPYSGVPTQAADRPLGYQRVNATPEAFGSQVAGATQQLGAQIQRSATELDRAAFDFQVRQDKVTADDVYSNTFSPAFRDLYQKYYSLQGKDAVDQMPTFIAGMQELRKQTAENLTERQQAFFDQLSRRRVDMELDGMARYANQQNRVYKNQVFESGLENLSAQAADKHNDEHAFGMFLGQSQLMIDQFAADTGRPAEWAHAAELKQASNMAVNRISRMMVDDPVAAKAWYDNPQNQKMIEPDKRPLLERQLKAAVLPIEIKTEAQQIMGAGADAKIKSDVSGGAPFPAAGNGSNMRVSVDEQIARDQERVGILQAELKANPNDEALKQELRYAQDRLQSGNPFGSAAPRAGDIHPTTPADTRASLGSWIAEAEKRYPNDPVKRDALINQIKSNVSTIVAMQQGVQLQAHSTITRLMMPDKGAPPVDVSEVTATPQGQQAWALLSPESQRGFISWMDQNQRKAVGKPAQVNAALVLDLGARIHLPPTDPNAISSPTQLIPYMSQGLTVEGKRSLEKELDERLTPDGRRLGDVRKQAMDALLPRFDSSTLMVRDEKGKEDFLKFTEFARKKEAELAAAHKDPYSIYLPSSPDYIGKDVPMFQRSLQEKIQDKADSMGRSASGKIADTGVIYNGFKFPNQAALDAYKAAGGK